MFKRILIANRGEIAVRIIRACREMGIQTVVIYSEADKESLHVRLGTYSVCVGPAPSTESYLSIPNIISAAKAYDCEAIHPGFGFLSENSDFARICEENDILFIGPSADIIDLMGNKAQARKQAIEAKIPVVPGSDGLLSKPTEAAKIAQKIGYPVLIKASAGGGGRGIRRVDREEDLSQAMEEARAEAIACFGDGSLYMEKLILNPKHVEIQILGDQLGNIIYLGERDCSIQRKNQKMIEESPCKTLPAHVREKMGKDAVALSKKVGYYSAGTIEFVLDPDGNYYFIEMNTRIQVEHPLTELVTGVDLIQEQFRIAAGLPLRYKQEEIAVRGHAIECRILAEDPTKGFVPSPGTVEFLHMPGGGGVRVDSALYNGYKVPPYYDSMLAKVIVHAPTRREAIRRMRRVLEEFVLEGFETNVNLCHQIMFQKKFVRGDYDVSFLPTVMEDLILSMDAEDVE